MCATHTAPADAPAPDANRAGPSAPASLPDWLVHFIALLVLFLLRHTPAARRRRGPGLPPWWFNGPNLLPESTQAAPTLTQGPFGKVIARLCRQWGVGPGHKDWPYLSRTIVAFGGSLHGLDGSAQVQPWWDSPALVPGMIRADTAPTRARASLHAACPAAEACWPPVSSQPAPRRILPAVPPAAWRPVLTRAATGPPTGPPARGLPQLSPI